MKTVLSKAGYKVHRRDIKDYPALQIEDEYAVNNPDKIAQLLVNSDHPPTLLKVQVEDLEKYFLRTIKETGGR